MMKRYVVEILKIYPWKINLQINKSTKYNETEFVCNMDGSNKEQCILESGSSQHVNNNLHLLYDR